MTVSLGFVGVYAVLIGVASFMERPLSRGVHAVQLNVLIRGGSLATAAVAVLAVHGLALPSVPSVLAGLGIGLITGIGSIFYCFALGYLPVSLVVTFSNLYLVVTILLGIVLLREPVTVLKLAGLATTLAGVLLLSQVPARYGVHAEAAGHSKTVSIRAVGLLAAYIVLIGIAAFLEKPALRGLDATQLNALMAVSMAALGGIVLAVHGPPLRITKRTLGGFGVGAMIGLASVFYFLGLRDLPISIAAAASSGSVVVTVMLSAVVLHQPLTGVRSGAIGLTVIGVVLLALSAG
ncbi:MAG: EamA family transporter [Candidatus Dormibacteria bacterium]